MDLAYSLTKKADFSTLVVIGVTPRNHIYVMDIVRFKTDRIGRYFESVRNAYEKWGFRKIRIEATAAQKVIVRDLKENYIVPNGMSLSVDEYSPTRHAGTKDERMSATLEPKYDNMQVWHYKGGETAMLEDELVMTRAPHDDIKDGLTAAIDIAVPPRSARSRSSAPKQRVTFNTRFGGVQYRK
jgi:hypothetical protein